LTITADGGGSNGTRVRLWKVELQKLADQNLRDQTGKNVFDLSASDEIRRVLASASVGDCARNGPDGRRQQPDVGPRRREVPAAVRSGVQKTLRATRSAWIYRTKHPSRKAAHTVLHPRLERLGQVRVTLLQRYRRVEVDQVEPTPHRLVGRLQTRVNSKKSYRMKRAEIGSPSES
jgi:hypothetical protein